MDPSHFWWQGIDPVSVIEEFGDRIGYSHGKDTLLYPDRIRRQGVLHYAPPSDPSQAPWHFASVGEGHDDAAWAALIKALQKAGYDEVISIEHEDPRYDGEEGTARSLAGLKRATRPGRWRLTLTRATKGHPPGDGPPGRMAAQESTFMSYFCTSTGITLRRFASSSGIAAKQFALQRRYYEWCRRFLAACAADGCRPSPSG